MPRIVLLTLICVFASCSARASDRSQLVFDAIRNNDLTFLKALSHSDLQLRDKRGSTPLMHAAAFGSREALRLLLKQGAGVNEKNDFHATALLWGAGDAIKARLLIAHGADVNAQSKQGRTPLMIAARHDGNSGVVALLLNKGADPRVKDSRGVTALHQAAHSGDVESIGLLLAKGADVNWIGRATRPSLPPPGRVQRASFICC